MQQMRHVYEVSELNHKIKQILEEKFPFIWISGEISNFRRPNSGHCYFTLKDEKSQIGGVVFRTQANALRFEMENGIHVIGLGRLALYEPRGTYQVIFEYLDPKGIGGLQVAFEALKKKLFEEGLFDDRYKKRVPLLPRKISIITSPSGAAVLDFLQVAQRRFVNLTFEIVGVRVQGGRAPEEIITALQCMNEMGDTDVIVLARGGGSIEDLAAFNSERLARAIFSSNIPVVSAVGHETDFTISDFVADLRAPTPSAAAEIVVPLKSELQNQIQNCKAKLYFLIDNILEKNTKMIEGLTHRIVHPKQRIQDKQLRIDELFFRLETIMKMTVDRKKEQLQHNRLLLQNLSPAKTVKVFKKQLLGERSLLITRCKQRLKESRTIISSHHSRLETLSPLSILNRGYSITRSLPDRAVVRNAKDVDIDQPVEILLADGQLQATIFDKS